MIIHKLFLICKVSTLNYWLSVLGFLKAFLVHLKPRILASYRHLLPFSPRHPFSGGKNSSTGKQSLSKSSQGLFSEETAEHSSLGIQKSITGTISCTSLSSLTMVNKPSVTSTFLTSSPPTRFSSKMEQIHSGTEFTSVSQQQQQVSVGSTIFAPSAMGSTTSVCANLFILWN